MNNSLEKIYNAIVLDTNTIKTSGFKFKSGKLDTLEQFAIGEFDFLLPEIVKKEVLKHYKHHLEAIKSEALNKLKTVSNYNLTSISTNEIIADLDNLDVDQIAQSHLEEFIEATGAIELAISEYGNMQEIVDDYFQYNPPFAKTGDKKAEFPDAICLQLINKWSEKNCKKVLAVSKDKDWQSYIEKNENIDLELELENALGIFVKQNTFLSKKIEFITSLFEDNLKPKLNEVIKDSIINNLDGKFFDVHADADMGLELDFESITYLSHEVGNFNIVELNLDDRVIVVNYLLNVNVELEATADFYHWDKEDGVGYSLSCESKYSEEKMTADLTLKFMFPDDIEDILEIKDIDDLWLEEDTLELETTYFNFGYLEPDLS